MGWCWWFWSSTSATTCLCARKVATHWGGKNPTLMGFWGGFWGVPKPKAFGWSRFDGENLGVLFFGIHWWDLLWMNCISSLVFFERIIRLYFTCGSCLSLAGSSINWSHLRRRRCLNFDPRNWRSFQGVGDSDRGIFSVERLWTNGVEHDHCRDRFFFGCSVFGSPKLKSKLMLIHKGT